MKATLTITEALKTLQTSPAEATPFSVLLACGFTPLHLQTFLGAHLQQLLPDRKISLSTGLFGDLVGALNGLDSKQVHATAVIVEWETLDPRLGFREAGSWKPSSLTDILSGVRSAVVRIEDSLHQIPAGIKTVVSLPTLPLPPFFHTPGWQASEAELLLDQIVCEFGARLVSRKGISLVDRRRLAENSPPGACYDLKSDLLAGLPYTVSHASQLSGALARLLAPSPPKKGLITDLDDTLWDGLAGEVGPDGVTWDLASHQQIHGLYQKMLASLSGQGVLIGIASKNDPAIVEKTFQRTDILLRPDDVFPIEANWNSKSASVARILHTWNIAADSVVFIDDSAMELGEVAAAHPGITCIQFPKGNYPAAYQLFSQLRDLFGKEYISDEDSLRLASIRQGAEFLQVAETDRGGEAFLEQLNSVITLEFQDSPKDRRAWELVNKTNQFNLNGARYTEADWVRAVSQPDSVLMVVNYEDRFGPLGKIAVLQGRHHGDVLDVDVWVMSCRSFSRRVEHQCLRTLFERFGLREMAFQFARTPKNGPLREFFGSLLDTQPESPFSLSFETFQKKCSPLYHRVVLSE
jgi:FkbH-like protein